MESMQGKRKHKVNINYFETWSPTMAYVLGFLTADGSVYNSTLSIDLATKDKYAVEFIRDQLSPEKKVEERKNNGSVRVRVNSVQLCRSIVKFGIVPKKTGIEKVPQIPKQYFCHYLRGVFDGDGWVYTRRNTVECGIVSASEQFLKSLRDLTGGLGQIHIKARNRRRTLYSWDMYSNHAERFRDIIYYEGGFALSRKKEKFFSSYKVKSKRFWTDEQIKILIKSYTNCSLKTIADKTGRSYKAVSKKVWELGLANEK